VPRHGGAGRTGVWRRLAPLAVVLAVLGGVADMVRAGGIRVNLTPSLPRGLYRTVSGAPRPGTIVLACLPEPQAAWALARGYLLRGDACPAGQDAAGARVRVAPIGKLVLAVAGDTITVSRAGLTLNGRRIPASAPASRDSHGRALVAAPGREAPGQYVLRPGEVWLWSDHPLAFDSRHTGPVPTAGVLSVIVPIWPTRQSIRGR
jgi:conjugative transfer signal peptidase TraF